jgi:hypothetical protein
MDPVAGAYQKGPSYWEHIHKKWCVLHAAAPLEKKVYAEVRTVDQLYNRWKKHINKDMAVFMRYLGQVYIDMPTGTPEKEYISVAAKRYKEAQGRVFRFESCVPTLVQLPRYSLNRFKRNRTTCLAVATNTATFPRAMSEDEDDDDDAGEMGCYHEDDNHVDEEVTDSTLGGSSSLPGVPPGGGRFLIAPTYAPPPGKTTGTKKAKAMLAAARASRKNLPAPPPPSQVSIAAELVAKSVSEMKFEIARLAGTTQDQLKLDEEKLKLEEVKLKLEEVNTYIRLGMKEEAASSMAAFSAVKKRLVEDRLVVVPAPAEGPEVEDQSLNKDEETECSENLVHNKDDGASVNLLQEPEEERKEEAFLEECSSESSLSSFRFRRPLKKQARKEEGVTNPSLIPGSVVVDNTPRSPIFGCATSRAAVEPTATQLSEWKLQRKKRRLEKRAAVRALQPTRPLLDQTNMLPPDVVEVDWRRQKTLLESGTNTQLTLPDDLQSTHSGSVCYRGDTQKDVMY